jgi:hypothetical protein
MTKAWPACGVTSYPAEALVAAAIRARLQAFRPLLGMEADRFCPLVLWNDSAGTAHRHIPCSVSPEVYL